jgi:hypothetical protein
MQTEITQSSALLNRDGKPTQIGWSRQPMLDCNLENAAFYPPFLRPFQRFRIKRWDYYAVFTPLRFFSATIADLGYAGNIFVYILDFKTKELHEEGLVIPLANGIQLPRNSLEGETSFSSKEVRLRFLSNSTSRQLFVDWPAFHEGRGIYGEISLNCPSDHESMTIVIPIEKKRFYYNRKINCLPAEGELHYGGVHEKIEPQSSLGSLDWGRGVWAYKSFWNWASASGFLPDGRTVGLNLGCGFGDLSAATENCLILNGRLHKLEQVSFDYDRTDYRKPWRFSDTQGRLDLNFLPFVERVAQTNLKLIFSEVHQMFGQYSGRVVTDEDQVIQIENLVGFAEEHQARW